MSRIPADILRLEREAIQLAYRLAALEQRNATTEQAAAALWYNPSWETTAAPTANFTVTGQVVGCDGTGVPSCAVTIVDASTSAVYATAVTDATGHYSTSGTIPGSSTSVKVHLTPGDPYASRFASYPPWATTLNLGSNTRNPTQSQPFTAAAGYHCSGMAYFPLAATLQMTDSVIGSTTLTWSVPAGGWGGTISYNYPGCAGQSCSSAPGLTVSFGLGTGSNSLSGSCSSFNGICPANGGTAPQHPGRGVIMTMTQASPFQASGTSTTTTDALYCSGAAITRTLTE